MWPVSLPNRDEHVLTIHFSHTSRGISSRGSLVLVVFVAIKG